jgi:NAD(P)-dependent dehydrogenase (short-subunit alcohol dehydrogenase family)
VAREGGIPVIADTDLVRASDLKDELAVDGLSAHVIEMDLTDNQQVTSQIARLRREFEYIDAVINFAYPKGTHFGRKLADVEYVDFCDSVSKHLGGVFLLTQKSMELFAAQGFGNLVNVASIYGIFAPRFEMYENTTMTMPVEYAAIKAGVIGLSRYFAKYYLRDGIRVNVLAPGGIEAGQDEEFVTRYRSYCGKRGLLDPADLDGAVRFLLSDDSKFMTGQVLLVDDGWSL